MFARYTLIRRSFSTAAGKPTIGWLGLGNMGLPMADNMRKGGFEVKAFDLMPEARQKGSEVGLNVKDSMAEAVSNVDFVITSLPMTKHVDEVLKSEGGIFAHAREGTWICDTSTISPIASQEFAVEAKKHGMTFLDTPVSGGVPGAKAGSLTFMVGAPSKDDYEKVLPILDPMGANFFHCGDVGSGEIAKLTNNLILGITMVAASEGLAIGEKLGMDPKILNDIVMVSSGNCFSLQKFNPRPGNVEGAPSNNNY